MDTQKRLLAVLAHPDDESFGPGGTLAKYAAQGVEVHIAIATDGAAGSVAKGHEHAREQLVAVRAAELERAAKILGGHLHHLGYRDSGMQGDAANGHPQAFVQSKDEEAIERVVRLIRTVRPQVVMTHDETGGYYHPDHIRCWQVVTAAFKAAGDGEQYPQAGAPYQPQALYYTAISKRWITLAIWTMRLTFKDPRRVGVNKDIDLTRLGIPSEKVGAVIDIRPTWEIKRAASAEHASQGGGNNTVFGLLPRWLVKWLLGQELFIQAYPTAVPGRRVNDLFAHVMG